MTAHPAVITFVRCTGAAAAERLDGFVFGSKFVGNRPPRGLDPQFVSQWIREFVNSDTGPMALSRVAHTLRFYERGDVLDHLSPFLSRTDLEGPGFLKNAAILQCIGEVGSEGRRRVASGLFQELLIGHPLVMQMFQLLLDTAESLADTVDTAAIRSLMRRELEVAAKAGDPLGPGGLLWRKYTDYDNNQLPQALAAIEGKRRLLAADPVQRLPELVAVYLGESAISSPTTEVWAGRLLRKQAMTEAQPAVLAAFATSFDAVLDGQLPAARRDFLVHRAAEAIIYLQGELTARQRTAFSALRSGPQNFLWDDL